MRNVEQTAGTEGRLVTRDSSLMTHHSSLATRLGRWEPWLVGPCALLLLLYPNPLALPAAVVGSLPTLVRWVQTGRPWRTTAFDLPLALLVLGALLGAYAGLSRDGTWVRLTGLLAGLLLYSAILEQAGRSPSRLRIVTIGLLVLVAVGSAALLLAVAPFLRLDRLPPLATAVGALDLGGGAERLSDESALLQRYRFRASGVGALAAAGLAVVFAIVSGIGPRRTHLALVPLAAFFVLTLVAADNRGSMLVGAVALAALAAYRQPRLAPFVPVAGLLMLGLFEAGLVERGLDERTIGQRFWFWDNSLFLASELPLTGAGLGTQSVQLTYQAYFQPAYPPFSHAHNIYLQGLLEQGVFGLLGLAGLTLATFWLGWRVRHATDPSRRAAGFAGLGVALVLFGAGLSEIAALSTVGGALLLAALGLLAAATSEGTEGRRSERDEARMSFRAQRGTYGATVRRSLAALGMTWSPDSGRPVDRAAKARRLVSMTLVALVLVGGGLWAGGASLLLLNLGTAELNKASLSEDVNRAERVAGADRAVTVLRAASGLDPRDATIQRNLALALAAKDDGRRARATADRAKALTQPDDRRAQFQLGRAYAAIGAWSETVGAWEAAEAGPQLVQLGGQLIRARNWNQAVAAYTTAAIVQPRSSGAYEGLARIGTERGDTTAEMVAAFDPLIARGGLNEYHARTQVARIYRGADQPDDALESLRLAELAGRGPELGLERGLALAQLGRWTEAMPLLESANRSEPDEIEVYYWLGQSRLELGRHGEAARAAGFGLARLDPRDRTWRPRLLAVLGDGLLGIQRLAEALAACEEGLAFSPDEPRLRACAERARAPSRTR